MQDKFAFANSLGILTTLFYGTLLLLRGVAPQAFEFIFNAQFGGAKVTILFPKDLSVIAGIENLLVVAFSTWLMGFLWAWLYNKFAK